MLDFLHYPKYSDKTLEYMTKKELISQIHCLLHNWEVCAECKENVIKYAENLQKQLDIYQKENNYENKCK